MIRVRSRANQHGPQAAETEVVALLQAQPFSPGVPELDELTGGPQQNASATPGLAAYDLYLRGLYLRNGLSADGLRQASQYFDSAIARVGTPRPTWCSAASFPRPTAGRCR